MSTNHAQPVYLDVDTGVDDALALLLAVRHPALDVRGVTTVAGNVDLEQVTRNTLQVLEVAGASDVPVAAGADRPLVGAPRSAAAVHGQDGLGNASLPPPRNKPVAKDAIAFLRDELMAASEPVNIIALAPLTNIALLLQSAPEIKSKIRRLAVMGGAVEIGNATPVAEFNIYHDPEAADIVFRSGIPVLLYTLDVFRQVTFAKREVDDYFASLDELSSLANPHKPEALAGHLFHFMMRNFGRDAVSIGDAGCVASLVDDGGLTKQILPVYVETGGKHTRGQTVVDRRPLDLVDRRGEEELQSSVDVALAINTDFYRDMFRQAVGRPRPPRGEADG